MKLAPLCCLACLMIRGLIAAEVPAAPTNPYNGMQEPERVFEFTDKPKVAKDGDKWVVTFASKAACDATVAILDKDGRVIRHLASGVLGKNAPWPFQQNALSQKLEWDGQTDQFTKANPAGCKVRVSLGLAPEFESSFQFDPYEFAATRFLVGDKGEERYVLGMSGTKSSPCYGRVFTKDGKYVRTFWPPPARDVEKLPQFGLKLAKTDWGDSIFVTTRGMSEGLSSAGDGKLAFDLAEVADYKEEAARPAWLPPASLDGRFVALYNTSKGRRLAADRVRDEIYVGGILRPGCLYRLDGKTGKLDESWFGGGQLNNLSECVVGPDGNVYVGVGGLGYNRFIVRLDREGKVVPFGGDAVPLPKGGKWEGGGGQYGSIEGESIYGGPPCPRALAGQEVKALWTGVFSHSPTFDLGFHVSPAGHIVAGVMTPAAQRTIKDGADKSRARRLSKLGPDYEVIQQSYVVVWDNDGKLLTANAVGDMQNGHGVAMDREGNIYAALGGRLPAGQKTLVGLSGLPIAASKFEFGSLLKFRGGVAFPRARNYYMGEGEMPKTAVRFEGMEVFRGVCGVEGALLWTYNGLCLQQAGGCTCGHVRYDVDYFARHWIPANYLYSVVVVDANGNVVARVGRYGNASDADPACGKIHFVWPKALAVSDTALYVMDAPARRIVKAAIKYAAEETLAVP